MIEIAWKATLILAVAGVASVLARRTSAAVRHLVWLAALASLLMLPMTASLAPAWRPALPATLRTLPQTSWIVIDVIAERGRWQMDWQRMAWLVWVSGALALAARAVLSQTRAARLAARATVFPGYSAVRLSGDISIPMVVGLFDPVVLLPSLARSWSAERMRLVLRHELAHVVRRDTIGCALAELACALYWPHPLVWFASARLRQECEQACDDAVLEQGEKASLYAEHLVDLVRGLTRRQPQFEGGIAMARVTDLEHRLKAMLSSNRSRRAAGPGLAVAATLAAIAVLLPLSAFKAPAQTGAAISGVVRDASGATVPKARVTLLFPGSDRQEFTTTSDVGEFSFKPLTYGLYNIKVAKGGFALLQLQGVTAGHGAAARLELVLNVGQVSETVDVAGERPSAVRTGTALPTGPPTRIRVGGNVQATKLDYQVRPVYPPDCKAEGVQGSVLLRAVIGKDGSLLNVEPVNQLVDNRLAEAALAAVRLWRYKPTLLNGVPVEVVTMVTVNFTLE
ncbi:MAG: M56 family metallopeptidase [Bryobacteraceae bacterium]